PGRGIDQAGRAGEEEGGGVDGQAAGGAERGPGGEQPPHAAGRAEHRAAEGPVRHQARAAGSGPEGPGHHPAAGGDARAGRPAPARRSREPVELVVRIKAEGMRLDHYLHLYFPDFSRSELQDAIKAGTTLVNGKPSKASYKVRNGDKLYVVLPEPDHDLPQPE